MHHVNLARIQTQNQLINEKSNIDYGIFHDNLKDMYLLPIMRLPNYKPMRKRYDVSKDNNLQFIIRIEMI